MIPISVPGGEDCACGLRDWQRRDLPYGVIVSCARCGTVVAVSWWPRIPRPEGMVIHHIDGSHNNDPANLPLMHPHENRRGGQQ